MNRTFLSAVLLLALLTIGSVTTAYGEANWVSLEGKSFIGAPSAEVLNSDQNQTTIKFTTSGFFIENTTEGGDTYQRLEFPKYATTLEVGRPELPVISELVSIPGNAHVTVSIVDYKEITLSGYKVHPFQTPLPEGEKRVAFDLDEGFYRQNAFYPEVQAGVGEPGIWRDLRVVSLKVSPIRYNPATGELKVCSEITVRLDYTGTGNKNVKSPLKRPVAENYDRMYGSAVLNYSQANLETDGLAGDMSTDGEGYDYLIIADDQYLSNMTSFVTWKEAQGLATQIVPISSIGADDVAIKAYIANEYTTNGISYVLLVGDPADVPSHINETPAPGNRLDSVLSDYWYSLLEGDDDFADLAIGRFSVGSSGDVDNMVSKSVTFESNPPAGEWLEKSLLVANWEEAPLKYQECKEQVRTASETSSGTYSVLYPDFTTAYGASFEDGGDEASNQDVINYFNDGFRLVNYRGHGSEVNWQYWNVYGEYFDLADVDAFDNGQMTPVVFSIACLNNNLLYINTTIGEAFTRGDDGAVAYLGASDPSYTVVNHDYDKQLYAIIFDEGTNAIGDASNEASVRAINLWGSYGVENANMYLWLGDPSLQLIYGGYISCCQSRGDFNQNGQVDILDVDDFIEWLFRVGPEPTCVEAADVDGNEQPNILDVDYLIEWLFRVGPDPVPCP